MANNAKKDENGVSTLIAASKNDGITIVPIYANPANHGLKVNDASTGTDSGNNLGNAMKDENGTSAMTAISSSDGSSIVEVYGDPATGMIYIDSN